MFRWVFLSCSFINNLSNVNRHFPSKWGPVHMYQLQWRTKILGKVIENLPFTSVRDQICRFSIICTSVTIWIPRMASPPHDSYERSQNFVFQLISLTFLLVLLQLISDGGSSNSILDASNRFYTLIPHDFGMKKPPMLDNLELIQVIHTSWN